MASFSNYASPVDALRETICEFVEQLCHYVHFPWCMIGDLNQVMRTDDKDGGRRVVKYNVERMKRMMTLCGFTEMDSGPRFAWTNNNLGSRRIQKRLD